MLRNLIQEANSELLTEFDHQNQNVNNDIKQKNQENKKLDYMNEKEKELDSNKIKQIEEEEKINYHKKEILEKNNNDNNFTKIKNLDINSHSSSNNVRIKNNQHNKNFPLLNEQQILNYSLLHQHKHVQQEQKNNEMIKISEERKKGNEELDENLPIVVNLHVSFAFLFFFVLFSLKMFFPCQTNPVEIFAFHFQGRDGEFYFWKIC